MGGRPHVPGSRLAVAAVQIESGFSLSLSRSQYANAILVVMYQLRVKWQQGQSSVHTVSF
jgi:hypothetical protein